MELKRAHDSFAGNFQFRPFLTVILIASLATTNFSIFLLSFCEKISIIFLILN